MHFRFPYNFRHDQVLWNNLTFAHLNWWHWFSVIVTLYPLRSAFSWRTVVKHFKGKSLRLLNDLVDYELIIAISILESNLIWCSFVNVSFVVVRLLNRFKGLLDAPDVYSC